MFILSESENLVRLFDDDFQEILNGLGVFQAHHRIGTFRAHDGRGEDDGQVLHRHLIATRMQRDSEQMFR